MALLFYLYAVFDRIRWCRSSDRSVCICCHQVSYPQDASSVPASQGLKKHFSKKNPDPALWAGTGKFPTWLFFFSLFSLHILFKLIFFSFVLSLVPYLLCSIKIATGYLNTGGWLAAVPLVPTVLSGTAGNRPCSGWEF